MTVPFRAGLTGNIASGKSTVAEQWRGLGAAILDADVLARRAVAPGTPGLAAVAEAFGPDLIGPDGALDRAALRERAFTSPEARRRLESIVHPEVARLRAEEERRLLADAGAGIPRAGGRPVLVHDIPLLFEVGLEGEMDVVVLVDAPEEERLRRLVELRGLDAREARAMMDAQMPAEEKRPRADRIIDNSGSLAELRREAEVAWMWVLERAAAT